MQSIRGIKKITERNVETLYEGLPVTLTQAKKWRDYFGFGVVLPKNRMTISKIKSFSESDPTTTRDAIINADRNSTALRNMVSDLTDKVDALTKLVNNLLLETSKVKTLPTIPNNFGNWETFLRDASKVPNDPTTPKIVFGTGTDSKTWDVRENQQFFVSVPEGMNVNLQRVSASAATTPMPSEVAITAREDSPAIGGASTEGDSTLS